MISLISENDYSRMFRAVYADRTDLYKNDNNFAAQVDAAVNNAVILANNKDIFKIEKDGIFIGFSILDISAHAEILTVLRQQGLGSLQEINGEISNILKLQ